MTRKILFCLILLICVVGCKRTKKETPQETPLNDLQGIKKRGELRVLTLYSSTSYFLYKGQEMGYEYELIKKFAESENLKVKIIVAENISKLVEMLQNGDGDVIAYDLPITGDLKKDVLHCGPELITHQVLIQPRGKGVKQLNNVIQLVGKDIYVEGGSKYETRIKNLNDELGGGIRIHIMNKDTLVTEDLIGMVSSGEIPYTLADNNIARLNKTYYNNIDIGLEVSFPQRASWAVRSDEPELAKAINNWIRKNNNSADYKSISKRYFEYSKNPPAAKVLSVRKGQISIFDHLFKKYAKQVDWDWRLIASQAFQESRFDTTAVSWAGAQGLMQLMPRTAKSYGLEMKDIRNPEKNIQAAVKSLIALNKSFSYIKNPKERKKFILASYNSGIGHVYDAIALAKKYGKQPDVWDKNVAEFILLKSNPEYFNDEVCRFGYFRGRETFNYVNEVLRHYEEYKSKIPH